MMTKFLTVLIALAALSLLGARPAAAAPMKCSGEQTTCIAVCQKAPRALIADCVTSCRARFNYCRQTGCWDNGKSRYCRLLRQ
jgi:hypothetical protein